MIQLDLKVKYLKKIFSFVFQVFTVFAISLVLLRKDTGLKFMVTMSDTEKHWKAKFMITG